MLFDKGFAPLGELKARLGISDSDDDAVLTEILKSTAATIERIAGRTLRRDHGRTEIHSGGERTIRLALDPVAKVHQVRESSDRDFEDSTKYTELVEGTDFVLEAGVGGKRPGDSAVLRRLGADWLGDERNSSGQIEVVYTAGFKTDDEIALENNTLVIVSPTELEDFSIQRVGDATDTNASYRITVLNSVQTDATQTTLNLLDQRNFVRFDVSKLLFPVWNIASFRLDLYISNRAGFPSSTYRLSAMSVDAALGTAKTSWDNVDSGGNAVAFADQFITSETPTLKVFDNFDVNTVSLQNNIDAMIRDGHLSFGGQSLTPASHILIDSVEATTVSQRPTLTVEHRRGDGSLFNIPGDLRHANLIQAVHEYQMRKYPGTIPMSQRGTTIASGSAFLKTIDQVLHEVVRIANSYRRFF